MAHGKSATSPSKFTPLETLGKQISNFKINKAEDKARLFGLLTSLFEKQNEKEDKEQFNNKCKIINDALREILLFNNLDHSKDTKALPEDTFYSLCRFIADNIYKLLDQHVEFIDDSSSNLLANLLLNIYDKTGDKLFGLNNEHSYFRGKIAMALLEIKDNKFTLDRELSELKDQQARKKYSTNQYELSLQILGAETEAEKNPPEYFEHDDGKGTKYKFSVNKADENRLLRIVANIKNILAKKAAKEEKEEEKKDLDLKKYITDLERFAKEYGSITAVEYLIEFEEKLTKENNIFSRMDFLEELKKEKFSEKDWLEILELKIDFYRKDQSLISKKDSLNKLESCLIEISDLIYSQRSKEPKPPSLAEVVNGFASRDKQTSYIAGEYRHIVTLKITSYLKDKDTQILYQQFVNIKADFEEKYTKSSKKIKLDINEELNKKRDLFYIIKSFLMFYYRDDKFREKVRKADKNSWFKELGDLAKYIKNKDKKYYDNSIEKTYIDLINSLEKLSNQEILSEVEEEKLWVALKNPDIEEHNEIALELLKLTYNKITLLDDKKTKNTLLAKYIDLLAILAKDGDLSLVPVDQLKSINDSLRDRLATNPELQTSIDKLQTICEDVMSSYDKYFAIIYPCKDVEKYKVYRNSFNCIYDIYDKIMRKKISKDTKVVALSDYLQKQQQEEKPEQEKKQEENQENKELITILEKVEKYKNINLKLEQREAAYLGRIIPKDNADNIALEFEKALLDLSYSSLEDIAQSIEAIFTYLPKVRFVSFDAAERIIAAIKEYVKNNIENNNYLETKDKGRYVSLVLGKLCFFLDRKSYNEHVAEYLLDLYSRYSARIDEEQTDNLFFLAKRNLFCNSNFREPYKKLICSIKDNGIYGNGDLGRDIYTKTFALVECAQEIDAKREDRSSVEFKAAIKKLKQMALDNRDSKDADLNDFTAIRLLFDLAKIYPGDIKYDTVRLENIVRAEKYAVTNGSTPADIAAAMVIDQPTIIYVQILRDKILALRSKISEAAEDKKSQLVKEIESLYQEYFTLCPVYKHREKELYDFIINVDENHVSAQNWQSILFLKYEVSKIIDLASDRSLPERATETQLYLKLSCEDKNTFEDKIRNLMIEYQINNNAVKLKEELLKLRNSFKDKDYELADITTSNWNFFINYINILNAISGLILTDNRFSALFKDDERADILNSVNIIDKKLLTIKEAEHKNSPINDDALFYYDAKNLGEEKQRKEFLYNYIARKSVNSDYAVCELISLLEQERVAEEDLRSKEYNLKQYLSLLSTNESSKAINLLDLGCLAKIGKEILETYNGPEEQIYKDKAREIFSLGIAWARRDLLDLDGRNISILESFSRLFINFKNYSQTVSKETLESSEEQAGYNKAKNMLLVYLDDLEPEELTRDLAALDQILTTNQSKELVYGELSSILNEKISSLASGSDQDRFDFSVENLSRAGDKILALKSKRGGQFAQDQRDGGGGANKVVQHQKQEVPESTSDRPQEEKQLSLADYLAKSQLHSPIEGFAKLLLDLADLSILDKSGKKLKRTNLALVYENINQLFVTALAAYHLGQFDVVPKLLSGINNFFAKNFSNSNLSNRKIELQRFILDHLYNLCDYMDADFSSNNPAFISEFIASLVIEARIFETAEEYGYLRYCAAYLMICSNDKTKDESRKQTDALALLDSADASKIKGKRSIIYDLREILGLARAPVYNDFAHNILDQEILGYRVILDAEKYSVDTLEFKENINKIINFINNNPGDGFAISTLIIAYEKVLANNNIEIIDDSQLEKIFLAYEKATGYLHLDYSKFLIRKIAKVKSTAGKSAEEKDVELARLYTECFITPSSKSIYSTTLPPIAGYEEFIFNIERRHIKDPKIWRSIMHQKYMYFYNRIFDMTHSSVRPESITRTIKFLKEHIENNLDISSYYTFLLYQVEYIRDKDFKSFRDKLENLFANDLINRIVKIRVLHDINFNIFYSNQFRSFYTEEEIKQRLERLNTLHGEQKNSKEYLENNLFKQVELLLYVIAKLQKDSLEESDLQLLEKQIVSGLTDAAKIIAVGELQTRFIFKGAEVSCSEDVKDFQRRYYIYIFSYMLKYNFVGLFSCDLLEKVIDEIVKLENKDKELLENIKKLFLRGMGFLYSKYPVDFQIKIEDYIRYRILRSAYEKLFNDLPEKYKQQEEELLTKIIGSENKLAIFNNSVKLVRDANKTSKVLLRELAVLAENKLAQLAEKQEQDRADYYYRELYKICSGLNPDKVKELADKYEPNTEFKLGPLDIRRLKQYGEYNPIAKVEEVFLQLRSRIEHHDYDQIKELLKQLCDAISNAKKIGYLHFWPEILEILELLKEQELLNSDNINNFLAEISIFYAVIKCKLENSLPCKEELVFLFNLYTEYGERLLNANPQLGYILLFSLVEIPNLALDEKTKTRYGVANQYELALKIIEEGFDYNTHLYSHLTNQPKDLLAAIAKIRLILSKENPSISEIKTQVGIIIPIARAKESLYSILFLIDLKNKFPNQDVGVLKAVVEGWNEAFSKKNPDNISAKKVKADILRKQIITERSKADLSSSELEKLKTLYEEYFTLLPVTEHKESEELFNFILGVDNSHVSEDIENDIILLKALYNYENAEMLSDYKAALTESIKLFEEYLTKRQDDYSNKYLSIYVTYLLDKDVVKFKSSLLAEIDKSIAPDAVDGSRKNKKNKEKKSPELSEEEKKRQENHQKRKKYFLEKLLIESYADEEFKVFITSEEREPYFRELAALAEGKKESPSYQFIKAFRALESKDDMEAEKEFLKVVSGRSFSKKSEAYNELLKITFRKFKQEENKEMKIFLCNQYLTYFNLLVAESTSSLADLSQTKEIFAFIIKEKDSKSALRCLNQLEDICQNLMKFYAGHLNTIFENDKTRYVLDYSFYKLFFDIYREVIAVRLENEDVKEHRTTIKKTSSYRKINKELEDRILNLDLAEFNLTIAGCLKSDKVVPTHIMTLVRKRLDLLEQVERTKAHNKFKVERRKAEEERRAEEEKRKKAEEEKRTEEEKREKEEKPRIKKKFIYLHKYSTGEVDLTEIYFLLFQKYVKSLSRDQLNLLEKEAELLIKFSEDRSDRNWYQHMLDEFVDEGKYSIITIEGRNSQLARNIIDVLANIPISKAIYSKAQRYYDKGADEYNSLVKESAVLGYIPAIKEVFRKKFYNDISKESLDVMLKVVKQEIDSFKVKSGIVKNTDNTYKELLLIWLDLFVARYSLCTGRDEKKNLLEAQGYEQFFLKKVQEYSVGIYPASGDKKDFYMDASLVSLDMQDHELANLIAKKLESVKISGPKNWLEEYNRQVSTKLEDVSRAGRLMLSDSSEKVGDKGKF